MQRNCVLRVASGVTGEGPSSKQHKYASRARRSLPAYRQSVQRQLIQRGAAPETPRRRSLCARVSSWGVKRSAAATVAVYGSQPLPRWRRGRLASDRPLHYAARPWMASGARSAAFPSLCIRTRLATRHRGVTAPSHPQLTLQTAVNSPLGAPPVLWARPGSCRGPIDATPRAAPHHPHWRRRRRRCASGCHCRCRCRCHAPAAGL